MWFSVVTSHDPRGRSFCRSPRDRERERDTGRISSPRAAESPDQQTADRTRVRNSRKRQTNGEWAFSSIFYLSNSSSQFKRFFFVCVCVCFKCGIPCFSALMLWENFPFYFFCCFAFREITAILLIEAQSKVLVFPQPFRIIFAFHLCKEEDGIWCSLTISSLCFPLFFCVDHFKIKIQKSKVQSIPQFGRDFIKKNSNKSSKLIPLIFRPARRTPPPPTSLWLFSTVFCCSKNNEIKYD